LDTLKFSLFIIYKYVVFVSFFVVVVLNPFLLNYTILIETTTKPQEIKRENRQKHYIREEPAAADQRVSNS
jgi:hypothetical protein